MPRIAVIDNELGRPDVHERMCAREGIEVSFHEGRSPERVIEAARGAQGIITSYAHLTREVFAALPDLKVVSRTGVGIDAIDLDAATEFGVAVCNVPGYSTESVSDHAIALALCVLRRINEIDADMRRGVWANMAHRPYGQVRGRCFGVVGMGDIGRAVARKAAGLGFDVVCCSRSLVPGSLTREGFEVLGLDGLCRRADVLSLHTALTPETHHLIDARRIGLLKPGAVVVNTSRGGVLDADALADALERDALWGAGIDVYEHEPVDFADPICRAPHTVLTSHMAYWSEESGEELLMRSIRAAVDVVAGRRPQDCLNPQVLDG